MKKTGQILLSRKMLFLILAMFLVSSCNITIIAQEHQDFGQLVKNLQATDPLTRAGAAFQLGLRGREAEAAIPQLIKLLGDDNPVDPRKMETWRWHFHWRGHKGPQPTSPGFQAAYALGNIGKAAVKPLLAELDNPSWFVRMNVVDALDSIEDPATVKPLMNALKKEKNIDVKIELLSALGDMEDKQALKLIGSFTTDKVVAVRLEAILALEELESREAAPFFLAAVKDREPDVRGAAISGLEEFEDAKYLPVFIEASRDENKKVRYAALEAMDDLESPETQKIFLGLLSDNDPELVYLAINALGDMEVKKAVPALVKLLQSKERKIKIAAIEALGDIGDSSAAIELSKILETEKDSEIKRMVMEAISDIY